MAGIYIHIPFCKKACYYCDFYFTTSQRLKPDFLAALDKEITGSHDYLSHETIETIYFGGGTPSRLSGDEIKKILDKIRLEFKVKETAEITLEANPDDLTKEKIRELQKAGINRLSIGVQSFFDEHLKWMNRAHVAGQAFSSIRDAQQAGITNITIDLIYGIPGLTDDQWEQNLDQFFELSVPHLSAYALTVEKKTPLHKLIASGKYESTDDSAAAVHFELLMQVMKEANWIHYEISNFASGVHTVSKHNTAYWKDQKYLGLGPSAHSYNGRQRRWNSTPLQKYVDKLQHNEMYYEQEHLSMEEQYNEKVLTGLRTMWGVDAGQLGTFREYFIQGAMKFIEQGFLNRNGDVFTLTNTGKLFADRLSSDLFFVSRH